MLNRRSFLKTGVGLMGLSVAACYYDPDSSETVLDYLLQFADDVTYEVRRVNGAEKAYVTAINGRSEDKHAHLYWLFTVDGKFVDAAVNEVRVGPNSVIVWKYMRPRDLAT